MKKPLFSRLFVVIPVLIFVSNMTGYAQIAGSAGALSLSPAMATVIDPAITVGGSSNLTDATVQITANFYAGDVLSFNAAIASSFGITGLYTTTAVSGILTFTGTTSPANWQTLFRTVTYQNTTASCGPSARTVIFLQGNYLFNGYNGHFYEFVNTALNWKNAKAAAASRSFNGMQGYLATSTSVGENNFIWKLMAADGWVGATYDYQEINEATGGSTFPDQYSANGKVYWVTGPEKGTWISSGFGSPVSINGQYMNWNPSEPNNFHGVSEYYIELYSGAQGKWNDLPLSSQLPYLVEYGDMPGDAPQSNTFSRPLILTSTVGGDITGGNVTVCAGSNSTILTSTAAVSGVTIVQWESSFDNFLTAGTVINNTTSTLTATNLTQTTYFRSIANGNSCSNAPSSSTKIAVGTTVAGSIGAVQTTLCNNGVAQLTLSGNTGNVLKWQSSPDNNSWTDIANTTGYLTSGPLSTGTYYYRAQIQNPACITAVFTNPVTLTVLPTAISVGGTITGNSTACGPGNSGALTLTGYAGNIIRWQYSDDDGNSWYDIGNTTSTYNFNGISSTLKYRAQVQNNPCNSIAYSNEFTVIYVPAASSRWIGEISTDFGTAGNWLCTVPGPGDSIIISTSAPYMPVLDQDRTVGSITFENNTNININGYALTINGVVTGTSTGNFTGSEFSSLNLAGGGNLGTLYFDQSNPGTTDLLGSLTINREQLAVPTPPSSPVCIPDASWGYNNEGITNVTLGSINNSTASQNGFTDYSSSQSTNVDPSSDYTLSITTDEGYYYDQGIKVWIDWNNNGIFGDGPNEVITDLGGGVPGTYDFNFTAPAMGGDITGGSKTMRIYVDNYYYLENYGFDACYGGEGEYEDYKINLLPLPMASGEAALGTDLSIGGLATFTNGIIHTGSNILKLSADAAVSGASKESHVNGNVRKTGNTAFTFPVGDDNFYAPVSMSAPSGMADNFTASYVHAAPLSAYNNINYVNGIVGISSNEYWILNRTNGNSNVEVTLSWDNTRSTALTNLGLLRVARWNGSAWANAGSSGPATGDLSAGTVTSNLVTDFSPFTIAISSIMLPVNLLSFTAIREDHMVNLAWQTASEINSSHFEIERSINGTTWIKIGDVKAQGYSNHLADYHLTDAHPVTGNNYYRLKQFDNDGRFVYSPVRMLNFTATQYAMVYPNPFAMTVTIDNHSAIIGDLSMVDMTGRTVYRSRIMKTKETINLSHLAAGQYTIIYQGKLFKIIKMPH